MRKILTLVIAPFLLLTGIQAQTTQAQADAIVLERMNGETRPYSIYAKEDIQPAGTVLTTSAGEIMVFEYEHWLYYVSFTDNSQNNCYLVVKESNGSLLEVNVKNDEGPDDLQTWKFIYPVYPIDIPFSDFYLPEECYWYPNMHFYDPICIITSEEELEVNITCNANDVPINFEQFSLICFTGATPNTPIYSIEKQLQKVSNNEYHFYVDFEYGMFTKPESWHIDIQVPKLPDNAIVRLIKNY